MTMALKCILRSRIHQFYIDGFIASTFLFECPGLPLSILLQAPHKRPTKKNRSNHSDLREDAFNHGQVQNFLIGKTRIVVTPRNAAIYKWYISGIFPANWGIILCHLSYLLGEPFQQPLSYWRVKIDHGNQRKTVKKSAPVEATPATPAGRKLLGELSNGESIHLILTCSINPKQNKHAKRLAKHTYIYI